MAKDLHPYGAGGAHKLHAHPLCGAQAATKA